MAANFRFEIDNREVTLNELKDLLPGALMQASLDHIVDTAQGNLGNVRCPIHGEVPQVTISLVQGDLKIHTASCCQMFADKATAPLQRTLNQTAYFKPGKRLILHVQNADQPFVFDIDEIQTIVIGRSHPDANIDLQEHDAAKKGVSRRHAAIKWHRGALHIVDEGSSNGTYVNEQQVENTEPHILHDGDNIRLGQLVMEVMVVGSGV